MKTFQHIHSSSKYDRSPASLATAAKSYFKNSSIVTWTEIERNDRASALRGADPEWRLINGDHSNQNDCGISFDTKRFKLIYSENFKAGNTPFYIGSRPLGVQYMTVAVLEDRTNSNRVVIGVIHLASGIEGDWAGNRSNRNIANWIVSFRAAKNRLNRLKRKYGCKGVVFVADFNLDFKKAWVRSVVKGITPSYVNTWRKVNVGGGTHGNRIIDATLLKGKLRVRGTAVLHKDDDSSDHRPYRETLVWL